MHNTELLRYGKYISALISSVILNTEPPVPFEGIDWIDVFKLAKKHDVAAMIFHVIKDMEIPADAFELFEKSKNRIVARTTRQSIESERVFSLFEANNIRYIKLKGIHIKDFYPAPYMRVYSDVDICVSKEDREKAKPLMKSLGYELEHCLDYHDEYEKDDFYIYEVHYPIVSEKHHYWPVFSEPFTKAVADSDSKLSYVLNNEYFYLHLFFHLYQHFITRGCGIRLFMDLLVFEQNIKDVDYGFIESVLKQYDMLDFYNSVHKLNDFFFFDKKADSKTVTVAQYILKNKANNDYKFNNANLGFWGKIRYFLKNWFPSAKNLAFRYPVLNKAPILLPVCWLRRIFYSLFFNRSAFKTQAEHIKELNSTEYKKIKKARQLATKE